jgi:16S rRNA (uracil1498-N3)-methyltransferase
MRISRIYHPEGLNLNQAVTLTPEKSHYLINVMRYGMGDEIILFHQSGLEFLGKIVNIDGKKKPVVTLQLHSEKPTKTESELAITLIQGLAKNDKMDWIVQKAVELGVAEIYPVITEFSEVRLNLERMTSKQLHWQNIAISAAEQSERTHVPLVHFPQKIADCLPKIQSDRLFCLHPHQPALTLKQGFGNLSSPKNLSILVGPEGGFSPKEIMMFEQKACTFVTLGARILRTETAAIVMQSLLQHHYGDML